MRGTPGRKLHGVSVVVFLLIVAAVWFAFWYLGKDRLQNLLVIDYSRDESSLELTDFRCEQPTVRGPSLVRGDVLNVSGEELSLYARVVIRTRGIRPIYFLVEVLPMPLGSGQRGTFSTHAIQRGSDDECLVAHFQAGGRELGYRDLRGR